VTGKLTLTKQQARRFVLAHQGLWPPHELEGKSGVLGHIRRVGCIQFDPLNIVGHNTELVLQARVSDFRPSMLQELLYEDRKLLDGLDKNMSIYCVEDWPYFRRRREAAMHYYGDSSQPATSVLPQVRKAIEERGPLSSIDLDFDQTVDWWWAPTRLARAALESMYFWGELIIHHKVNTRKVYDFFDYIWEVYKPVAERRYGYYVLPVLYGDRFVARFEPGRNKKSGALMIKNWWWEDGVNPSKRMQSDLLDCFKRFLIYLGTDDLRMDSKIAERAGLDWLAPLGDSPALPTMGN
jgi:uncharacterized protein YcaQ